MKFKNSVLKKMPLKKISLLVVTAMTLQVAAFGINPIAYGQSLTNQNPMQKMVDNITKRALERYESMSTERKISFLSRSEHRYENSLKRLSDMSDEKFEKKQTFALKILKSLALGNEITAQEQAASTDESSSAEEQDLQNMNADEKMMNEGMDSKSIAQISTLSPVSSTREKAMENVKTVIEKTQAEIIRLQSQAKNKTIGARSPAYFSNADLYAVIVCAVGLTLLLVGLFALVPTMGAGLGLVVLGSVILATSVGMFVWGTAVQGI